GCRAVTGYTRNMTDEMIKALAAKGGVVNINFGCEFLSQSYFEGSRELNAKIRPQFEAVQKITDPKEREAAIDKLRAEFAGALPPATIDDVVAHIDHVRKVAGIDAIGIGTDFDGVACVPKDLDSYAKFPNLTRKLLEKGYTAEDIKKIYGANMLRVMKAVEDRAKAIQAGK
ncbi:MAG: membrane dipeptidase, partial [Acidobacteria bacterium]|nr:membrane dipeptidase [Acidobacteriota bacterium]